MPNAKTPKHRNRPPIIRADEAMIVGVYGSDRLPAIGNAALVLPSASAMSKPRKAYPELATKSKTGNLRTCGTAMFLIPLPF
jgi:hypothetical protein